MFYILCKGVDQLRTLKFIANGLVLEKDPNCDFSGLVPGSSGYIQAEFTCSPEWQSCPKVAAFYSVMGKEYPAQLLEDGMTCMVPAEALSKRIFKVQLIGKSDKTMLTTNRVEVDQNGGAK